MKNYQPGELVDFQGNTYSVVKEEGEALVVKRAGSHEPISIPKNQAHSLLEEGRTPYNVNSKLNG